MRFGLLIGYNMRNIEKSYTKCGAETSPRPSSRKSKLNISLDKNRILKFYAVCFYCMFKSRATKIH